MIKAKEIILSVLIVLLTASLVILSNGTNNIMLFENLSQPINKHIFYQSVGLIITFLFLFILWITNKEVFRTYFRKGDISAEITPEPWVGIKPKSHETWLHFGRNIGITISVITAVIMYFQLVKGNEFSVHKVLTVLPFSILFSLSNSFIEESITRLGVIVVLKGKVKDRIIPLISALLFGGVHYFGNPGGIPGVLAAGFLGWFLAKSILETKGIFWAWLIHFVQDVIIFSVLLTVF